MKKIFTLLTAIVMLCSASAQKYSDDLNQGIAEFNKHNYTKAAQLFAKAEENGCKAKHLQYYYAVCDFYKGEQASKVEQRLVKALMKDDLRAAEFYAVKINWESDEITNFIYSNYFPKKEYPRIFFCRANMEARKGQEALSAVIFKMLSESLKMGYSIPRDYLRNNPIEKYDQEKYFEVLANYNIDVLNFDIENYVKTQMSLWQQKGKFEKTAEYKERVNEVSREIKMKELAQQYIDSLGSSQFDIANSKNEYDADNEVFKIVFEKDKCMYVPVPIDEAQEFDKNFNALKYENASYTLAKNEVELLHLEIVNPANNKTYVYDSKEAVAFNTSDLNLNFDEIDVDFTQKAIEKGKITEGVTIIKIGKSDVDDNIPEAAKVHSNKFALIIGNENYQKYQTGLQAEQNVAYAMHDALTFKEYCIKTLGIPSENIIFKTNAGVVQMQQSLNQMNAIIKNMNGDADVVVYYAGHGFPDEKTSEPYLVPVDVSSSTLYMAVPLNKLVSSLVEYPSKKVVVFLDACFTGGGRDMGLLASRGVKIVPKEASLAGNLVLFSASSAEQSALPYREKTHGMFTYYLLKKLQDSKGEVTLSELDNYLSKEVSIKSTIIHSREQNPNTHFSPLVADDWGNWKLN